MDRAHVPAFRLLSQLLIEACAKRYLKREGKQEGGQNVIVRGANTGVSGRGAQHAY
jgi:hypothetical protein